MRSPHNVGLIQMRNSFVKTVLSTCCLIIHINVVMCNISLQFYSHTGQLQLKCQTRIFAIIFYGFVKVYDILNVTDIVLSNHIYPAANMNFIVSDKSYAEIRVQSSDARTYSIADWSVLLALFLYYSTQIYLIELVNKGFVTPHRPELIDTFKLCKEV